MKIYLAHNFGKRYYVRDTIQPIVEEMYPEHEVQNPFMREGGENQGLFETDTTSEKELIEETDLEVDKRDAFIVNNDIKHLEECDMLVAYIENASVGTSSEIFYNSYILEKPTILIFPSKIDLYYHPWLNYLSDEKILLEEIQ